MRQLTSILLFVALSLCVSVIAVGARNESSPNIDTTIIFTLLPPYGQLDILRGRVSGVDPARYKVAVYISIEGIGWWSKPFLDTVVTIDSNSNWTCFVRPVESDTLAIEFHAALLPNGNLAPRAEGFRFLPPELNSIAVARTDTFRFGRSLPPPWNDWWIKKSVVRVGPDTNYFNERNAFVDSLDRLHLRISRRTDGRFDCAEVINKNSSGYGKYIWQIESGVGRLDRNVVLGLFTWDNHARDYNSEIDIEFSRWGMITDSNVQYVVQPHTEPSRIRKWILPVTLDSSTHCFDWSPSSVSFKSVRGFSNDCSGPPLFSWTYAGPNIPTPSRVKKRMNLWLVRSLPPSDSAEVEVIIRRCSVITSVGSADRRFGDTPSEFALHQNYPNPFNPTTEIRYQIPEVRGQRSEVSRVTLRVFDILGREVATLVDEVQDAGFKSAEFDASGLSSGVYFYRIHAGDFVQTKKLLLMR